MAFHIPVTIWQYWQALKEKEFEVLWTTVPPQEYLALYIVNEVST